LQISYARFFASSMDRRLAKDITLGEALGSRLTEPSRTPSSVLEIPFVSSSLRNQRGVLFEGWAAGLSYYREGELVVSLGDERDCVAVSSLELERASDMSAAAACCVNEYEDLG
jgi:hypothetical protein